MLVVTNSESYINWAYDPSTYMFWISLLLIAPFLVFTYSHFKFEPPEEASKFSDGVRFIIIICCAISAGFGLFFGLLATPWHMLGDLELASAPVSVPTVKGCESVSYYNHTYSRNRDIAKLRCLNDDHETLSVEISLNNNPAPEKVKRLLVHPCNQQLCAVLFVDNIEDSISLNSVKETEEWLSKLMSEMQYHVTKKEHEQKYQRQKAAKEEERRAKNRASGWVLNTDTSPT